MNAASRPTLLVLLGLLTACQCENGGDVVGSSTGTTSNGESSSSASESMTSTGFPFDASRFIGRYHYVHPFLPLGERGDPMGSPTLANLEIFADATAIMVFDHCSFDEPVRISYEWSPAESDWLELRPGAEEPRLRFMAAEDLETLRVRSIEPCRELEFEADGSLVAFTVFRPGESCWVDRCTTPGIMQVDYCDGEQPPQCP